MEAASEFIPKELEKVLLEYFDHVNPTVRKLLYNAYELCAIDPKNTGEEDEEDEASKEA